MAGWVAAAALVTVTGAGAAAALRVERPDRAIRKAAPNATTAHTAALASSLATAAA
jgi:hypothetical protein